MPRQGTNQSRKIQEVEQALRMAASGRKTSFSIATNQAVAISPIGSASCGVAQVEITPGERIAMAGYSLARKVATDTRSPHFARALYVEDSVGNRAALCFLDLWSASRYLLYKTASMTSTGSSGIDHANLILAGTHTHAGPGRYFGNTLYDAIVQSQSGFYPPVADRLAELIGQCVNQAATSAVPARLGVGISTLWASLAIAAIPPFLKIQKPLPGISRAPGRAPLLDYRIYRTMRSIRGLSALRQGPQIQMSSWVHSLRFPAMPRR
jgi:hypothetical protein